MFSESSSFLLGQHGSCSKANGLWNAQNTFYKTFFTTWRRRLYIWGRLRESLLNKRWSSTRRNLAPCFVRDLTISKLLDGFRQVLHWAGPCYVLGLSIYKLFWRLNWSNSKYCTQMVKGTDILSISHISIALRCRFFSNLCFKSFANRRTYLPYWSLSTMKDR